MSADEIAKECLKLINEMYQRTRVDDQLGGCITEVDECPTELPKREPSSREEIFGDTRVTTIAITFQPVTPVDVAQGFNGEHLSIRSLTAHNYDKGPLMNGIGRIIAQRETAEIVRGIYRTAGHKLNSSVRGSLSKSDVENADKSIAGNQSYANTLLIPMDQVEPLRQKGELTDLMTLIRLMNYREFSGSLFVGIVGALRTYQVPGLKDWAFVYEKNELQFVKERLKVIPYPEKEPTGLALQKNCAAAMECATAAVKISLQP